MAFDARLAAFRRSALAAALLFAPAAAPRAEAAAGGGTSGFGGSSGGGSSGGGFSGGGGGSSFGGGSGGGSGGETDPLVLGILFAVVVLFLFGWAIWAALRRAARAADEAGDRVRWRLRRRRRVAAVELAAAEAARDDAAFEAERVRADGERLFRAIQAAWTRQDLEALRGLVGADLMAEWERRIADFKRKGWRNEVTPVGDVEVDYVGLLNRADDAGDRVVVRVGARLRDVVHTRWSTNTGPVKRAGASSEIVSLNEWWTLGKREDRWVLLSIEQAEEGSHHAESELVATPEADGRLRDDAVVELAAAGKVAEGFAVAEVADLDFDGDAHTAALDLSLADARFAPEVLEVAVRRAVAAWAEAVDGDDAALADVASEAAVGALLHPGDPERRTRLVIRGPQVRAVRIAALDAGAEPPELTVELTVRGRRYVEDRSTAEIVAGSQSEETEFAERWTLALDADDARPWRIVRAEPSAGAAPAR